MADKETTSSLLDISQLRTPIHISGKPVEQVLSSIHYGSPELRCLLMDECDLIFECKVCRALFRDLPNFISHKRVYCTKSSMENRHVTIASLPEEKVVVIQPQAPEETEKNTASSTRQLRLQAKAQRPNLEETIMRIQSGELGRSHAYQVYTEAAEKLQKQKEGMKVATIRTTSIPTNKNAVFIDVNMASVNIHERQQQSGVVSYDQNRNDTSVTASKRKTGERHENTRNMRKSVKQEKHSSEPQKLLLEQLKEIQQKRVKGTPQNRDSQKNSTPPTVNESSQKPVVNTNQLKIQKKVPDSAGLKMPNADNGQSVVNNEEATIINLKNAEKAGNTLVKRPVDSKIHPRTGDKNQLHTLNAVTAVKTRKRFAEQSLICSKCSAVFATRKSMSFHNKIHHSTKRTFYPCPYCQSVFYYFYGITRHLFKNHDKTLEEVNAMRKQLREKSFTKPLCTPSLSNETRGIVTSNSRSTRTFAKNNQTNLLLGVSGNREVMSVLGDRQLPKKSSVGNEIKPIESPSKTAHQKSGHLSVPHGERHHNQQSFGVTTDEKTENIEEPRSVRVKNKQQQRITESTGKSDSLSGQAFSYTGRVPATPSQTRASAVTRLKENTSHICPKCRRSFRRKISCKNHIKVCNAASRRSLKKLRPQIRAHKDKQAALELTTPRSMKTARVNKRNQTSSNDSGVKAEVTLGVEIISGVKNSARKDGGVVTNAQGLTSNIFPNSTDSRNTKVLSGNSASSSSRRSSSMDRVTNHDEPRNRSYDRSSAGRDQRDSSVESTQSNIEGKSPRSRRNVLSRYATPMQPSKSPAKCDILVKTNTSGEVESEINQSETFQRVDASRKKLDLSGAILSSDEEKTFNNGSEENSFELENESGILSDKQNINLSTVQDPADTSLSVMKSSVTNNHPDVQERADMNATTIIHKSEKSPEIINSSQKNQEHSPMKPHLLSDSSSNYSSSSDKHMSLHKQAGTTDRSLLFQIMSSGSLLKTEASSPDSELSKKDSSLFSNSSCEIKESEFVNAGKETPQAHLKKDPWKLQKGVADLAGLEYQSVWENSEIFKDSMMEKGTQAKKQKSVKLLELKYDSKTDHLIGDFNKHNKECLDIKVFERSSENSALKNTSGNSMQNKNYKPHSLQEPAVVSALSERPKRKRKVPSRNRDAEEMLSKILGHSNQAVPGKRRKLNPEPKTSVMPKQKLKSGDTINNASSVADLGGKDIVKINETADDEKEKYEVEIIRDDDIPESDDEVDEELGKVKGRFVSNRMYVLEKFGSKRKRLKCYDQVKVFKMIDEENLKCLECGELCTQVSNLRRHVIRQHLKWSRFKCKLCKFDSYDRSECTTHLIRGHRNLAINLRNVNRYIIDLVKKGSHARSIKKSQTIKVKQAQNQEENIYARPTVKKMLRLPQRTKEDSVIKPEKHHVSENSEDKNLDQQSQTKSKEQMLTPAQISFEVKSDLISQDPKPVAVVVTLSQKHMNTLTSSSKVRTFPEQPAQQQPSKPGLVHQLEGKDASLKVMRKSLPFNISTRNSPRTFDTRPYNPKNEDLSAASETTSASNEQYPLQTDKETQGKTVAAKTSQLKELRSTDAGCLQQVNTIPRDVIKTDISVAKVTSADNVNADHDSKNIFDKMKIQTTSSFPSDVAGHSSDDSDIVIKSVGSVTNEVYVTTTSIASEMSAPRVFEVKIKNPRHLLDKPKLFSQSPDTSIKPASTIVDNSKTKVISYILRGPQQKLTQVTDDVISPDLLAKSVIKVTKPLDQLSFLPPPAPCPEQIVKIAAPVSRVTSYQVIDPTNLQRKQACISVPTSSTVKAPSLEHIKLVPQRTGPASKELPGPSGMALAAALTKSGHISSTSASSFILSHGQAGKYIIYTRPAGAKELTTVGSLIKPMSVSSPVPSSSTVTVVNSSDAKPDSETQETASEKAFLPGTFVIRKHYL